MGVLRPAARCSVRRRRYVGEAPAQFRCGGQVLVGEPAPLGRDEDGPSRIPGTDRQRTLLRGDALGPSPGSASIPHDWDGGPRRLHVRAMSPDGRTRPGGLWPPADAGSDCPRRADRRREWGPAALRGLWQGVMRRPADPAVVRRVASCGAGTVRLPPVTVGATWPRGPVLVSRSVSLMGQKSPGQFADPGPTRCRTGPSRRG